MYIDSHTHLDFFEDNIEIAIDEINKNKIITLANSMDIESYIKNKEYSKQSEYIKPCFGVHPWNASQFNGDFKDLIPYIEESELIGEIGLDYVWIEDTSTYEKQREVFTFILEESVKRNKIVNLHTKGAEIEIYNSLKRYNYRKAIIHWYSGDMDTLDKFISLGCYFTISVDIGYSDIAYKVLDKIPLNKLLVETDGPTALKWVNGEYGYPSIIKEVVKKIANYKNIDDKKLEDIIYENYNKLLNL
ncbi:TatD family hydrolase [Clostridium sp. CCUG 7971]|uniref:TatD family hydrolase n=1 Tax=Clostridium sp. CCUG 7971 TaxID=2811414 RepID=UPI001ABB0AF3|nr:TatD family hydrolase [Clostridium sp. CCUG 7971]MBO3445646.1 TatD family hydrolase [Clostridium sp. CCUG 7971]